MQTFLPYKDFSKSAKVLDRQRLGKQRVETLQILKALTDQNYGWQNHPAVKMWRGYEVALARYGLAICNEWKSRGYKDTCADKIRPYCYGKRAKYPKWLGSRKFHLSHKSNLIRKNPEHYRYYFDVSSDIEYVWPV